MRKTKSNSVSENSFSKKGQRISTEENLHSQRTKSFVGSSRNEGKINFNSSRRSMNEGRLASSSRRMLQNDNSCELNFLNTSNLQSPNSKSQFNIRSSSVGKHQNRDISFSGTLSSKLSTSSRSNKSGFMDPDVAETLYALDRYLRLRNLQTRDIVLFKEAHSKLDEPYFTAPEFEKILLKMDLNLSKRQLRDTSYYLDQDGNGEIDPTELEEAVRKAKRISAPRDPMSKIADIVRKDPFANILSMTTNDAVMHVTQKR